MNNTIIVTGGAGFIGSNFILQWLAIEAGAVINLDNLTYAGNPSNLDSIQNSPRYRFEHADIADSAGFDRLIQRHQPRAIVHFAAESHVDRSISDPAAFIKTNVNGTFSLLECARQYWQRLDEDARSRFRFLHVSTDEVFGTLGPSDPAFTEETPYAPNSPYAASKASSDFLVRAYHHTYGLPTLVTNCSNNYGPFQFPEKLIPLTILNALNGKNVPVYGDGLNVRDWLFVEDHCHAIRTVLQNGAPGETYNIGGKSEQTNIEVVSAICDLLDEFRPGPNGSQRRNLITFVKDRAGHDRRYAIDAGKLESELGWKPSQTFRDGLRQTVKWYLEHEPWIANVASGEYRKWIEAQYADR